MSGAGSDYVKTNEQPAHAFLTSDLVLRSPDGCYFDSRCGATVKILGKSVSLASVERSIKVSRPCRIRMRHGHSSTNEYSFLFHWHVAY